MAHNSIALAPQPGGDTADGPAIESFIGYHLRRASGLFGTDFAEAIAGTDLRQVLIGILSVVAAEPGINQGAVGRRLGIQRANMVVLINQLIDLGFVERHSGDDKRSFALGITAAGRTALDACLARIRAREDQRLAVLSAAEQRQLLALLKRLNDSAEDT
jgi:DNA-binding MarR family transcriptional regulator